MSDKFEYAIQMEHIVKKFDDFTANDDISFSLRRGEVLAILGENGAGKSTLMNVLGGLYKPTSGMILVNGEKVVFKGPKHAMELGIGMVHQHFMLIPNFTVTENIILGNEPLDGIVVDKKTARQKVMELSQKYNMMIDPDALVCDITVGMQQRVEILKVLYKGVSTLILDEPTASLTPQEIDELMNIIRSLIADGKSVIIITHKLKEIKAIADNCLIIRRGQFVDFVEVDKVSEDDLATMMVGRKVNFKLDKEKSKPGELVLDVQKLCANDYRDVQILHELDIKVHRGEIVGIAGVDGNGQSELVEVLTGLKKSTAGNVIVLGQDITNKTPKEVFSSGVSSIPEDRQRHGLILDYSVEDNMIIQHFDEIEYSNHGFLNREAITSHAKKLIKDFDIRPENCANSNAGTLSGGNQQKVIIAREVENDKELLIAVNPTRGLDVGAIEAVHKYILAQRDKNKAVLLISFELDEILKLSDRIDVIFEGRIVKSLNPDSVTDKQLGYYMAGGEE